MSGCLVMAMTFSTSQRKHGKEDIRRNMNGLIVVLSRERLTDSEQTVLWLARGSGFEKRAHNVIIILSTTSIFIPAVQLKFSIFRSNAETRSSIRWLLVYTSH